LKKKQEKALLRKASAMIEASNTGLTLLQKKSYNFMLREARSQLFKDSKLDRFSIPASKILEFYEIDKKNIKHVASELEKLERIIVKYNLLGKDPNLGWGAFPLLSSYDYKDGIITFQLPFQIKDQLINSNRFAIIDLVHEKYFKNKYTLPLYEFLVDYMNAPQIPEIALETYKQMVGAEDKTYRVYDFIKYAVDFPVKEINNTDIIPFTVKYKLVKGRRNKIEAIKFSIDFKEWYLKKFDDSIANISKEAKELTLLLPEEYHNSITATLIQGLLDKYGFDDVKEAIEKTAGGEGFLPARIEQYLKEKH
jgi:hypothetical protein